MFIEQSSATFGGGLKFRSLGNDFPNQIWLELLIDKCIDFVWKTLRGRRNGKCFSIKSCFVKVAKVSRLCTVPQCFVWESTSKEKLLNYTSNITVQQNMNVYRWLFKLIKKNKKKRWEILIVFYWWIIICQNRKQEKQFWNITGYRQLVDSYFLHHSEILRQMNCFLTT